MKEFNSTTKVLLISALLLAPLMSIAGEATLTGFGQVQAPPEFVSLTVRVTSECFNSAKEVSIANDQVATQVLGVVKSMAVTANGDEVTATGGYVQRYTGYNPATERNICINTFRKINQIVFKTKAIDQFGELFATLQDKLYSLGMETNPTHLGEPTSFLEIGEPVPGLSPLRHQEYERKALALALQDAKEKFQSTLVLAGVDKYKIINYSENAILPRYEADETRRAVSPPASVAPVEFGKLTLTKFINVRFEYTGGELNLML